MDWLDITQIVLLVAANIACYNWGKFAGIQGTVDMFLNKKIITQKDLDKLVE